MQSPSDLEADWFPTHDADDTHDGDTERFAAVRCPACGLRGAVSLQALGCETCGADLRAAAEHGLALDS